MPVSAILDAPGTQGFLRRPDDQMGHADSDLVVAAGAAVDLHRLVRLDVTHLDVVKRFVTHVSAGTRPR